MEDVGYQVKMPRRPSFTRVITTSLGLVIAAAVLAILSCTPGEVSDRRVARIISTFKILPPYKVESTVSYLDGGSTAMVIRGSNWERVRFYWDGAIYLDLQRRTRLLYFGRVGDKSNPAELGSARESTLIDLLDMCAEYRLGPADLAVLDTIHSTGNRKRYEEWLRLDNAEVRRAGLLRMFVLALKQQRVLGYWQSADDNALPADSIEARRQRVLRFFSPESLSAPLVDQRRAR